MPTRPLPHPIGRSRWDLTKWAKVAIFFADVKRSGMLMFRIGVGGIADEAKARKLLAAKARASIDEFLIREQQYGA